MVELRWIERTEPAYRNHQTGLSLPAVTDRVLQWRDLKGNDGWGDIWSDWQDVPTVKEE